MAREIARLDVAPAAAGAFEAAAVQAVPLFRRAPGCTAMELLRSHEVPGRYWLVVAWDAVADHEAFRASEDFAVWRALVGGFFVSAPVVEHGLPTGIGFAPVTAD